ncbi:MAG: AAA family ATPase [Candidatus Midichloria sp.]|nr:AAA family ATPase [Candidatus Midichloria sp.]
MRNRHIGRDDFRNFIIGNDAYVDKSLFIQHVIKNDAHVMLITRPRRWGKSLNLDILKDFLSIEVDEDGHPIESNSNRVLFTEGEVI